MTVSIEVPIKIEGMDELVAAIHRLAAAYEAGVAKVGDIKEVVDRAANPLYGLSAPVPPAESHKLAASTEVTSSSSAASDQPVQPTGPRRRTSVAESPPSNGAGVETPSGGAGPKRRTAAPLSNAAPAVSQESATPAAPGKSETAPVPGQTTGARRRMPLPDNTANAQPAKNGDGTEVKASVSSAATTFPSEDKITDQDLVKACSDAAQKIGPPKVYEVLAEFDGATNVQKLKPDQRRKFLNRLKEEQEK